MWKLGKRESGGGRQGFESGTLEGWKRRDEKSAGCGKLEKRWRELGRINLESGNSGTEVACTG
jgi:hypothetical protein